jgi:lactoylglutathione lyase
MLFGGIDWVTRRADADITPNIAQVTPGHATLPPVSAPVSGQPKRPKITGLSHAAFYVGDLGAALKFYKDLLGYDEAFRLPRKKNGVEGELVWIKINDRQTIELFPGAEVAPDADRLYHIAVEVRDADAMLRYLASRGVKTPSKTPLGKIGNKNFFITDPSGNTVEIVEYTPRSWTTRELGKHMPATRVSTRMSHAGIAVGNLEATLKFYTEILGCTEVWRGSSDGKTLSWVHVKLPESDDTIELMLYGKAPSLKKLHSMHHVCLEVDDIEAAGRVLETRKDKLPAGIEPPTPLKTGINGKRQINYFDPDGTRVELMERDTVDGKPRPSSKAPPPPPLPRYRPPSAS